MSPEFHTVHQTVVSIFQKRTIKACIVSGSSAEDSVYTLIVLADQYSATATRASGLSGHRNCLPILCGRTSVLVLRTRSFLMVNIPGFGPGLLLPITSAQ